MVVVGVDLGGTSINVGLVDRGGILRSKTVALINKGDQGSVLDQIGNAIHSLKRDEGIEGIGIGVPAMVDLERGVPLEVRNIPGLTDAPLKQYLTDRFGVPTIVNNDANCFALGVYQFEYHEAEDLVAITIGTGLGAGIISNGRLSSGVNCSAGEIGEIPYLDGNLENYCSGPYLEKVGGARGEELVVKALSEDPQALKAFNRLGFHLARVLQIVHYTLAPEVVVLGGSVSQSYNLFKEEMRKELEQMRINMRVEVSTLKDSAILGAASLVYDSLRI